MIKLKKLKENEEKGWGHPQYIYKDWRIKSLGGLIMVKHFWVINSKLNIGFWQFKLLETKEMIEKIENDFTEYAKMDKLFKEALY